MEQNEQLANYGRHAFTAAIIALTCLASGEPYEPADLIACAIAIESAGPATPKRVRQTAEALRTLARTRLNGLASPAANRVAAKIVAYRNHFVGTVAKCDE